MKGWKLPVDLEDFAPDEHQYKHAEQLRNGGFSVLHEPVDAGREKVKYKDVKLLLHNRTDNTTAHAFEFKRMGEGEYRLNLNPRCMPKSIG